MSEVQINCAAAYFQQSVILLMNCFVEQFPDWGLGPPKGSQHKSDGSEDAERDRKEEYTSLHFPLML